MFSTSYLKLNDQNTKNKIINNVPIPTNINIHCTTDNPFSLSCSAFGFSNNITISPNAENRNPQKKPDTGEYPFFLCNIEHATPIIIPTIIVGI